MSPRMSLIQLGEQKEASDLEALPRLKLTSCLRSSMRPEKRERRGRRRLAGLAEGVTKPSASLCGCVCSKRKATLVVEFASSP